MADVLAFARCFVLRMLVEGGGANAFAACAVGETILPVEDTSFYNTFGGTVVCGTQRITYTGLDVGGGGALVGPGASPSSAPAVALASGSGLGTGVYQYAYTDVTAAGESLPSAVASITTPGTLSAPASAPTGVLGSETSAMTAGPYQYGVTFIAGSGETTPGPTFTITVGPPSVAPTFAQGAAWPSGSHTALTNASLKYSFLYAGGVESAPSPASSVATIDGTHGWTATIPIGGSNVIGRRVYMDEGFGGGYNRYQDLADNTTTAIANTSSSDTNFALLMAHDGSPTSTATLQVLLSGVPTGPAGTTARGIYRTAVGASQLKLLTTLANNTTTTVDDRLGDASLGANAPSSNTAVVNRTSVSGIAVGPTGVTSRKVYRTAVGASQLKLLATLADNTTTTYADSTADGSLGANAPTVDGSGLTIPAGQVLAGTTSLGTAGAGAFSASGGWAVIGNGQQVIRYTGITGNTLTGIPASGPGAIVATISNGSTATAAPQLTGIPASSTGSILYAINKGDPVNLLAQVDDLSAQAILSALLDPGNLLGGAAGIREQYLQDGRIGYTEAVARGTAMLELLSAPLISITYTTRDPLTKSGRMIHVDLPAPTNISGDFMIQQVTIANFNPAEGFFPTYTVQASNVRFSFEDLLRRVVQGA